LADRLANLWRKIDNRHLVIEMSEPSDPRIHVRTIRLSGWRAIAAAAAGLAVLVVGAVVLALSLLLVVLPAMVLGTVTYFLLSRPSRRTAGDLNAAKRTGNTTIIDATYKVTEDAAEDSGNGHESR